MANKFRIQNLPSKNIPLSSNDCTIVENNGSAYHVSYKDIYEDVLKNRLDLSVSRLTHIGSPNVLSVSFKNDDGTKTLLKEITLQDGMLSAIDYNDSTHILSLYFNASAVDESNAITVDLDDLKLIYSAGYGLGLSTSIIDGQQEFYVDTSAIAELTTMSSDIDSKIWIDGEKASSLCAFHISRDDFYQKIIDNTINGTDLLSNELYIVSSDFINAYDQQIKNLAEPALSNDATTKNYVDNACAMQFVEGEVVSTSCIVSCSTVTTLSISTENQTVYFDMLPSSVQNEARIARFVVDCTSLTANPPTINWPQNFYSKTGTSTDIQCSSNVVNVFNISEYAEGKFIVDSWKEPVQA